MIKEGQLSDSDTFDIFISYASADKEPVEILLQKLKADNFRVWIDTEQITSGPPTIGQIADGIANSSHMIACLSDTYIEREWTTFELETSLSIELSDKNIRTIPVKIKQLSKEIPLLIKRLRIGDLTESSTYDAEYERITRLIQRDKRRLEPPTLDRETLQRQCEAPFKHIHEPNAALFHTRVAVNTVCRFLYSRLIGEPPLNSTLDTLVQTLLSSKVLPAEIKIPLSVAQTYGNLVIKDRMEDFLITQDFIQPGLAALKVLADWTSIKYFGQSERKDIWESIWAMLPVQKNHNERGIPGTKYIVRGPKLGLNSLGALYAGRDTEWNQTITVNLAAISEERESAFFEEVAQFIRLNHAGIVRPLNANRVNVNGKRLCLYVSLEHVDGAYGQEVSERFKILPSLAACELCREVAISLEGFHSAEPQIVHGDIKPANIIIDRFGRVKVLCIGRNNSITVEDASSGTAGGKIDSFLFASSEQLSGAKSLTPKTDIFALRATLFYFLTGEYETRIRDVESTAHLPPVVLEALEKLVVCETSNEARNILDFACQELAKEEKSMNLLTVIRCYQNKKELPKQILKLPDGKNAADSQKPTQLEFSGEYRNAWPLGNGQILVWETNADTLAILAGSELLWRDSRPIRIRKILRGPNNELAVISWGGEVRCFTDGKLSTSVTLKGTIGDAQFCDGRWIVGTWQHELVSLKTTDDRVNLLDVEKGVFRIAVMGNTNRFAVADLSGGIAIYSEGRRIANIPPRGIVSSMAFAGRRIMALIEQSLIAYNLDGTEVSRDDLRRVGNARLVPSPYSEYCLLMPENDGDSWLINDTSTRLPYFKFPTGVIVLSFCRIARRFTFALSTGGCTYWSNGTQQRVWPDAIKANLSSDGHFIAVTFPEKVQLFEDPQ